MKYIKEYLPLLTVLLIIAGYLNTFIYYNLFGINIGNFLDASEILFSFSKIFNGAIAVFVVGTVAILFQTRLAKNIADAFAERFLKKSTALVERVNFTAIPEEEKLRIASEAKNELKSAERILLHGLLWFIVLLFVCILLLYLFAFDLFLLFIGEAIFIGLVFICLPCFLYLALNFPFRKRLIESRVLDYCIIVSVMILGVYLMNYISYRNVKEGHPKYNAELRLDSGVSISSNPKFHYIGSTSNYYFYYDTYSAKVNVYPTASVKWASIQQLRNGF